MKSLSFKELDLTAQKVSLYRGAVLEDAVLNNDVLLLLLKNNNQKISFVVDLRPKPYFLVSEDRAPSLKKQTKPIVLFLKARFLGSVFESIEVKHEFGRLVVLRFSDNREMEIHLFSQARNIILSADKAKISLNKVTELRPMGAVSEDMEPREPHEIFHEWMENFSRPTAKSAGKTDSFSERDKVLRKKQQGLADLQKKQQELESSLWGTVAQWLNEHRSIEVPKEYQAFVNVDQSVTWNIETAFAKAKQNKEKLKSVLERQAVVQQELERFAKGMVKVPKTSKPVSLSLAEGTKARTKVVSDDVRAFIGKSAEDNLKILRKAKAWHLWVHVKDLPGSHGIIAFDKSVQVPVEVIREVALWVVEQSLTPKQQSSWRGVKCDVMYCECRFVTPIRGDKLGRVNYKNEKVITVVVQ